MGTKSQRDHGQFMVMNLGQRVSFFAVAAISIATLWLVFELRYLWYINFESVIYLRSILGACVVLILICWTFFPSRFVIGLIGIGTLVWPLVLDSSRASLNFGFVPYLLSVIALLVWATELRRRWMGADKVD